MAVFPMKGIKNKNIGDFSHAHSILQSLCFLDTTRQILNSINLFNIRNNPRYLLTKEVFDLFISLYNGQEGNSENIMSCFINSYNNNADMIQTKNVLYPDPFHFIYFLLQFLHMENNEPANENYDLNSLYNQNLQNQANDNFMFELFKEFWNQTQNSIISQNFFIIERYTYKCLNCQSYYFYGIKNLFRIDVSTTKYFRDLAYPDKAHTNINLDDCLTCYCGGYKRVCKICGNPNMDRYTRIIFPSKVLIFAFEREKNNNDNNKSIGDVDFETNIDIDNYISKTRTVGLNINSHYILKACISLRDKYFADCYLNVNNNYSWYRYTDGEKQILSSKKEIFTHQPQILIYEIDEKYNKQINNNNQINYNDNFVNNNNNFNNLNNYNFNNNLNNNILNNNINNNFNNNQINNNLNNNKFTSLQLNNNFYNIFNANKINNNLNNNNALQLNNNFNNNNLNNNNQLNNINVNNVNFNNNQLNNNILKFIPNNNLNNNNFNNNIQNISQNEIKNNNIFNNINNNNLNNQNAPNNFINANNNNDFNCNAQSLNANIYKQMIFPEYDLIEEEKKAKIIPKINNQFSVVNNQ